MLLNVVVYVNINFEENIYLLIGRNKRNMRLDFTHFSYILFVIGFNNFGNFRSSFLAPCTSTAKVTNTRPPLARPLGISRKKMIDRGKTKSPGWH